MGAEAWASIIVAVVTVIGATFVFVKHLWKFIVLWVHAMETIQRELKPNGGGSSYDLIRKLQSRGEMYEERLDKIDADLGRLHTVLETHNHRRTVKVVA